MNSAQIVLAAVKPTKFKSIPDCYLDALNSLEDAYVLSQIVYRAAGNKFKPFYKFIAPCSHSAYRAGDSWVEELKIKEYAFKQARKSIGQWLRNGEAKNPDAYFWYWRTADHRTYYQVNLDKVAKLINDYELPTVENPDFVNANLGNSENAYFNNTDQLHSNNDGSFYIENLNIGGSEFECGKTNNTTNNTTNKNTLIGSDGLGFTDNGNNEVKGYESVTFRSEEEQSNPPSSAAPPLNYGSRIPKFGQLSIDYFEVQELLKVHPDAVLDLTPSTKHTFEELGRTYGIEKVKDVAKWLGESRASQYLPKVVNFIQAEQFAGDLNSMITAKQFAPPKAPSQKTPQHPLTKGPQPKLII